MSPRILSALLLLVAAGHGCAAAAPDEQVSGDDECVAALQLPPAAMALAQDNTSAEAGTCGKPKCKAKRIIKVKGNAIPAECKNKVSNYAVKVFDGDCENQQNCCCFGCDLWYKARVSYLDKGKRVWKYQQQCPAVTGVPATPPKFVYYFFGKVIPRAAKITGGEAITSKAKAQAWDFMWHCAWTGNWPGPNGAPVVLAKRTLVANSFTARSMHVLHIHRGTLQGGGSNISFALGVLLGCKPSTSPKAQKRWVEIPKSAGIRCKNSWIKTYPLTGPTGETGDGIPRDVYSEVWDLANNVPGVSQKAELYKNGTRNTLGTFGIAVISICASTNKAGNQCDAKINAFNCPKYMTAIVASTSGRSPCFLEGHFVKGFAR